MIMLDKSNNSVTWYCDNCDEDEEDEEEEEEELTGEALAEMDFEELEDVCDDRSILGYPKSYLAG